LSLPGDIYRVLVREEELTSLTLGLLSSMAIKLIPEEFAYKYDEAINEIDNLINQVGKLGGLAFGEAAYSLGLASLVARAAKLGIQFNEKDVEKALFMAARSMQMMRIPYSVAVILKALSPLKERAPNWWVALLFTCTTPTVVSNEDLVKFIRVELNNVREKVSED